MFAYATFVLALLAFALALWALHRNKPQNGGVKELTTLAKRRINPVMQTVDSHTEALKILDRRTAANTHRLNEFLSD